MLHVACSVCCLTSVEHHSWIIVMMFVSFICSVNAASHSGSISICCPTCLTTGSMPCREVGSQTDRLRDVRAAPVQVNLTLSPCYLHALEQLQKSVETF